MDGKQVGIFFARIFLARYTFYLDGNVTANLGNEARGQAVALNPVCC